MIPSVHFVVDDERLLDRYRRQLRHRERDEALLALATALSTSRAIPPGAKLLVRGGDRPVLALACRPGDDRRVVPQVRAVRTGCRRLHYVDPATARRLTAKLARRLRDELGDDVSDVPYIPIPTGGRTVLHMLGHELGLRRPAGTSPPASADAPVVLVDDIALSGTRFGQALATTPRRPIVFAHLYSHPQLRHTIAERHPDVRCLAAADLTDRTPLLLGERAAEWRRSALELLSPPRYWVGLTDHVCFPWNEPDRGVFDHDMGTVEQGWSLVRSAKNPRRPPTPVEIVSQGTGSLRPAPGVIFLAVGDGVLLTAAGKVRLMLRGAAAPMWRALVATGDRNAILHDLVDRYAVDESVAGRDLDELLNELSRRGLIAEHAAP